MQFITSEAQRSEMSGITKGRNKETNDISELKTKLEVFVNNITI